MNENLGVSLNSLIKLVISHLGILDTDLMGHYKAGLCLSGDDQVAKVSVIRLHVALTSA